MKTKKFINKSSISRKTSTKSANIISGKKKIALSHRQQIATVLIVALAIVGVTYSVYSLTYMNQSFAANSISIN